MGRKRSIISTKENKYLGPIDEFINKNLDLANKVVNTYIKHLKLFSSTIDIEDLLQVAYIGLIKAYYAFDSVNFTTNNGEPLKFSTYAYPKMHGEIRRFLRDSNINVKVSRVFKEKISFFIKNRLTLNDDYELISKTTGWTIEDVKEFILDMKIYNQVYLDAQLGDLDITIGDTIPDVDNNKNYYKIILSEFLEFLSLEQLEVYELIVNQGLSQNEVAKIVGVSQVQISRIFNKILAIGEDYGEGKFMLKR